MIFAGFSEGFREQGEKNFRKRQELAQAFEEFKRNNPYATYDEYQAFIDQRVGGGLGSNYLRGGVPGSDVLRQLSDDNAERRRIEEARTRVSDLRDRASLVGDMQGRVDSFLLGMDGNDFDGAYSNFIDQFGDGADDLFQGMNLRNYFTPNYRDQLIGQRLIDLTPRIGQYLTATGGRVEDTSAFARYLGIPEGQIQPFLDVASQEYDRKVADWTIQNNDRVISTINREVAAGRDPQPAIEQLLRGSGISADDFDIESAQAEATRIRELEDSERERALEESRVTATADMEARFRTDPAIQGAMRRGDEARVTELMLARARRYLTDEQFRNVYGVEKADATPALFTEVFQSEAAEAVAGQIDGQSARRDQATEAALRARTDAVETNQTDTFNYFKNTFGDAQAAIAGELASAYYIDNNMRAALTRAFSTIPEDLKEAGDVAGIRQYVLGHQDVLTAMQSGTRIQDYAQQRFDTTLGTLGGFNVESYDAWHTRSSDEITSGFRDIQADVDRAAGIEDPAQRLAYLQAVQRGLQGFVQDANTRIQLRGDRADRWVEYGTGGWNGSRAGELTGFLTQNGEATAAAIQNAIAEAQAEIDATPQVPQQASTAPSTTQSSAGRVTSEHSMNVNAVRDISEALGFALQDGTTANPFASAYDLAAAPFRLIGREYNENFVMSEAEEQRREAMREWGASNDSALVSIYAQIEPSQQREMLNDLQTMTPEAFEEKYQALLQQYASGDLRRIESMMPFSN